MHNTIPFAFPFPYLFPFAEAFRGYSGNSRINQPNRIGTSPTCLCTFTFSFSLHSSAHYSFIQPFSSFPRLLLLPCPLPICVNLSIFPFPLWHLSLLPASAFFMSFAFSPEVICLRSVANAQVDVRFEGSRARKCGIATLLEEVGEFEGKMPDQPDLSNPPLLDLISPCDSL